MPTLSCRHADFIDEVGLRNLLVAVESDERANPYGNSVCAQRQRFGHVGPVANAARGDQAHLSVQPQFPQGLPRHDDGRNRGNPAVLD